MNVRNVAPVGLLALVVIAAAGQGCDEVVVVTDGAVTADMDGDTGGNDCVVGDDAACDDGDSCTVGVCGADGVCLYEGAINVCRSGDVCLPEGEVDPVDACRVCEGGSFADRACDDGVACTADSCEPATGCVFDAMPDGMTCCSENVDCAEVVHGNCEQVTCVEGICAVAPEPSREGASCDDGDACTDREVCRAGACEGVAKSCAVSTQCRVGVCDPGSGLCGEEIAQAGAFCDDQNKCTVTDACDVAGDCVGEAVDCSGLDQTCALGACVPETGTCALELQVDSMCDDGDSCTADDRCVSDGRCVGSFESSVECSCDGDDANCDDGLDCTDDVCLDSGACSYQPQVGFCSIGGACYAADASNPDSMCLTCQPEASQATWQPRACSDENVCTSDLCDAGEGCLYAPVTNGASCDDSDACTTLDQCSAGMCGGAECECRDAADCGGDPGDCKVWSCEAFACVAVADSTQDALSCEDGAFCTVGEVCAAGTCGGGTARDCSGSGDGGCLLGMCDESVDGCASVLAEGGTACDDGDACRTGDVCSAAGVCDGVPMDCSGLENGCTTASCDMGTGQCVATYLSGGCDDGESCTLSDTCNATGQCSGSWDEAGCGCVSDAACGALSNHCNTGRCNVGQNSCFADPNTGTGCNDNNACTKDDGCTPEGGCAGTAYVCSAALSCQMSTCDGQGGCTVERSPGFCIIDGACYGEGQVNPTNLCETCNSGTPTAWTPRSGVSCNADNSGCSDGDICNAGVCEAGATVTCASDGLSCTAETCRSTGATSFACDTAPNGAGCFIGGACYTQGAPNPSNPCQRCDESAPTVWSNQPEALACNADGNGCTVGDACAAGVCVAGAEPNCSDEKTCTTDSCSATSASSFACVNQIQGTKCLIGGACLNDGAPNPANGCQACVPAAPLDWSNRGSGTRCGNGDNDTCTNPDTCDGAGVCKPNNAANDTACGGSPGACHQQDRCLAGRCTDRGFLTSGALCGDGANNTCTNPDSCDAGGLCRPNHAGDGTHCGDTGTECINQDVCVSGSCADSGFKSTATACGSQADDACTDPGRCSGLGACNPRHASSTTTCGSASACKNAPFCSGAGACRVATSKVNGTLCGDQGSSECDNADACLSGVCDSRFASKTTPCGSSLNNQCTNPDTCNGSGGCSTNDSNGACNIGGCLGFCDGPFCEAIDCCGPDEICDRR
ncbi:MAG: hypothetical protein ACI9MR_000514 [Myxococcota bacterium]|jgi:hypothetical protein